MTASRQTHRVQVLLVVGLILGVASCTEALPEPSGALSLPIDFSYACAGEAATTAPGFPDGVPAEERFDACIGFQADGMTEPPRTMGVVLNHFPPGVTVFDITSEPTALDMDAFVPGFSAVRVGDDPSQIVRQPDFGAFWVISAGGRDVTRVVVQGSGNAEANSVALPGVPGRAAFVGGKLAVAAALSPELWLLDVAGSPTDPAIETIALPGRIFSIITLDDDHGLVTWTDRPVATIVDGAGLVPGSDVGLVPECRDTLDNDDDGGADAADAGCFFEGDTSEGGAERVDWAAADIEASPGAEVRNTLCSDDLDNDSDGLTDDDDPACASGGDGEAIPECGDGIDNDGDGRIDDDDTSCYGIFDSSENQEAQDGPFLPVVVGDGSEGSFVYVADTANSRIAIFEVTAGPALALYDVNTMNTTAPPTAFRSIIDSPPTLHPVRAAPNLGLVGRADPYLYLPKRPASMAAVRSLGEVWVNGIHSGTSVDVAAAPASILGCQCEESAGEATCERPTGDADTWTVTVGGLDGRMRVINAMVRGVPVHRLIQSQTNPASRGWSVPGKPLVTLAGRKESTSTWPGLGHPPLFGLSALGKEDVDRDANDVGVACTVGDACDGAFCVGRTLSVQEAETCSEVTSCTSSPPAVCSEGECEGRIRNFGLWPAEDLEIVADETWAITYEGVVPNTRGSLGRMLAADTDTEGRFVAPRRRFCEWGVEVGDWLIVAASQKSLPAALAALTPITDLSGRVCAIDPVPQRGIQLRVTEVGMEELRVDLDDAWLAPLDVELDSDAIRESDADLEECKDALEEYRGEMGKVAAFEQHAVRPSDLPAAMSFVVRASEEWIASGSSSSLVHPWMWDGSACVMNPEAHPRDRGRLQTATLRSGASYDECPPGADQLDALEIDSLVDPSARFWNRSFGLDMLPACDISDDGSIVYPDPQRNTTWSFEIDGPSRNRVSAPFGLSRNMGTIDHRGHIAIPVPTSSSVYLGTPTRVLLSETIVID